MRWRQDGFFLLEFGLSIIGGIGGVGSCMYCAGRVENMRGAGVSAVAAGLGALGFCTAMVMLYRV
jgi:hypothetical protein